MVCWRGGLGGSRELVVTVLPIFILATVISSKGDKNTFLVSLNTAFKKVFGFG